MCGILGLYNIDKKNQMDLNLFDSSLMKMIHRGPDDQTSVKVSENLIFGHVRLSIIDLNEVSNQPFSDENENYWITFNGEIFNYVEIKSELEELGYSFRTSSDTEVLLYAYKEWGEKCVNRFNGMWSFAIYDKVKNILFCSRDRFGIKPFNYAQVNGQFIFASEIKAILSYFPKLREPNYNVISNYCRSSVGAQIKETWFKSIFRLAPAHNMIIDANGIRIHRYWDYPKKIDNTISFDDALKTYRDIFKSAVEIRMRSDVPVGFTLSSGIDSTSIVSALKNNLGNNPTYTASFSKNSFTKTEKQNFSTELEINEPNLVKRVAEDLELQSKIVEVDFTNYTQKLSEIIYHLESGHGSPAIFPLDSILEKASEDVKVVLEGQGADELLGGYITNVQPVYIRNLIGRMKFFKAISEFQSFRKTYSIKTAFALFIRDCNISWIQKIYYKISGIDKFYSGNLKKYHHIKDFPLNPIGFNDSVNAYLFKSHTGGLVNLLHYGDAISMKHTLESRLPFMDYRLVEYVFKLPNSFKVNEGFGKYIHRIAMKGIVPSYILENRLKFGFDSPLSHIFSSKEQNSAANILLSSRCLNRGLFSEDAIEKAIVNLDTSKINYSRYLFRMLNVELWFREFIDDYNAPS